MTSHVATLSPKGQITIPGQLRDALGIAAGDRVELQVLRDGTVLLRPITTTLDELFGSMPYDGPARSIAEINAGIAEAAAEAGSAGRDPA
ncbi:AbrB/MazE/SpoVT family DNA-binding domain-containing protein [Methylobrevis albus]|uniref:AbrB/MazE/SpoVT family DNA-binding domain-containing protein n=1 Tax=Methylobrevis albus TaxID=2793297 RepID=A0A931MXQ2_9HYPH|nr:AbrB/MazE/SpoVT family DNA-binding domain-containing protein [Methylobrevis albus]MBH0237220.1 AbrB/MazE/SpoVT family DNA-binding domain-containing protein [Methylobrevis albus]